jgi:hypothetical protein
VARLTPVKSAQFWGRVRPVSPRRPPCLCAEDVPALNRRVAGQRGTVMSGQVDLCDQDATSIAALDVQSDVQGRLRQCAGMHPDSRGWWAWRRTEPLLPPPDLRRCSPFRSVDPRMTWKLGAFAHAFGHDRQMSARVPRASGERTGPRCPGVLLGGLQESGPQPQN